MTQSFSREVAEKVYDLYTTHFCSINASAAHERQSSGTSSRPSRQILNMLRSCSAVWEHCRSACCTIGAARNSNDCEDGPCARFLLRHP